MKRDLCLLKHKTKTSPLKKLEDSVGRKMVCAHAWSQLSTRGSKDDRDLSPSSPRNGCPKSRQRKGKTIGENTNVILFNYFVQIGIWGSCGYVCGSDLCLGIDGWQESRQRPGVGWRGTFERGSQWSGSVFPICKEANLSLLCGRLS